jgi:ubiquinone/menaquinone biosynthesis C-methylase UbiE
MVKKNFIENYILIIFKFIKKYLKMSLKKFDNSTFWVKLFILMSLLLILLNKYNNNNPMMEGFTQMKPYEIKKNDELYDDFYVGYYDEIVRDTYKTDFEFKEICYTTKPNKKKSKILDIGCGTGNLVKKFVKKGYKIKGVDKSVSMVKKANKKHPECDIVKKDAMDAMNHPPNSFTHILCTYFTIYYMKDKLKFFKNAYNWLKPNGTLTLHLVNRDKFNPIVNASDVLSLVSPQKYAKNRITNSIIKFKNFQYKADFKLQKHKNQAIFEETFKSDKSGNVRQNEHTLYMEKQKDILSLAKSVGFILQGKIDMQSCSYEYQYLYVLRKP